MNKYKVYRQIKNEYAYSLFKNNQTFEKVRAIIIKDGKILLVHKVKSDKYALPGGGVERGENIKIAVERESYEESKAKVIFKSIVGTLNYNVKMTFKGEEFISTRVEYYCLCEFVSFIKKRKHYGLNGEFFERVEVVWQPIENIDKCGFDDYVISKIKYINRKLSKKNNKRNLDKINTEYNHKPNTKKPNIIANMSPKNAKNKQNLNKKNKVKFSFSKQTKNDRDVNVNKVDSRKMQNRIKRVEKKEN